MLVAFFLGDAVAFHEHQVSCPVACGVRNTHPSSRNERRCCGSSRMYSAATNRNPWIGSLV
jgi:hypothetical protein